jgi:hypothetical protein
MIPNDLAGLNDWLPLYFSGSGRVPHGYRKWIEHLARLDQQMQVADLELNAAELQGLIALRAAREKYSAEHTACPKCGAAIDRLTAAAGMHCRCGHKF